jgi:site-specific DNA recombinase
MKDFQYYRCSGTDGYRFGGERICNNTQIRADKVEATIWTYVCRILKDPAYLEDALAGQESVSRNPSPEDIDALKVQRQKLQHGIDRLIDTFAEGVIDKDQFTLRMNRAKARLAELDAKIALRAADEDSLAHVHFLMTRLADLSSQMPPQLKKVDWATKREIIRAVIQRIEIGPTNIAVALRLPPETSLRGVEPILVTLSRA